MVNNRFIRSKSTLDAQYIGDCGILIIAVFFPGMQFLAVCSNKGHG